MSMTESTPILASNSHLDRAITAPTDNFVRYEVYTIDLVGMSR